MCDFQLIELLNLIVTVLWGLDCETELKNVHLLKLFELCVLNKVTKQQH